MLYFTLLICCNSDNLYRPVQREVIAATLEGEDVFLQAATSFGKSLCYQLPAVVDFGSMQKKKKKKSGSTCIYADHL